MWKAGFQSDLIIDNDIETSSFAINFHVHATNKGLWCYVSGKEDENLVSNFYKELKNKNYEADSSIVSPSSERMAKDEGLTFETKALCPSHVGNLSLNIRKY